MYGGVKHGHKYRENITMKWLLKQFDLTATKAHKPTR